MRKKQRLRRVLAVSLVLVLVLALVLSVVVSAVARAEAEEPPADRCEMRITWMEEEQALYIEQRLVYTNRDDRAVNGVIFYAAANMFRRQSALMYGDETFPAVFPEGYVPAGIDLLEVTRNGESADYGFRDKDEIYLRVGGRTEPGETCEFTFRYYLLLERCNAMIGLSDTDVRLSAFYFAPVYLYGGEFRLSAPVEHTAWLFTGRADFDVTLACPFSYLPAATGTETLLARDGDTSVWRFQAEGAREFALSFGRRWREYASVTSGGTRVRVLSNHRLDAPRVLARAAAVLEVLEGWFGPLPAGSLDILQTDHAAGTLSFPGAIWLPEACWDLTGEGRRALETALARQYIGCAAFAEPVADAWLTDVPDIYLGLLCTEELDGREAFLSALNDQVLDSLNITVPGGLGVTSDARIFTPYEYEIVVLGRGAAVMHELRLACGRETFLRGMRTFYEMRSEKDVLGELDLVEAFDRASGGSWEAFLTDWLFHVDEYVGQGIDFYE